MRIYGQARADGPAHVMPGLASGQSAICGVYVPLGATTTARPRLWELKPCPNCKRVLKRKAEREARAGTKGRTW